MTLTFANMGSLNRIEILQQEVESAGYRCPACHNTYAMVDVVNHFDAETGNFLCPNDNFALDDEAVEDGDQGQEMKTKYVKRIMCNFMYSTIALIALAFHRMNIEQVSCLKSGKQASREYETYCRPTQVDR